jgi:hypothetical protein
MHSSYGLFGYIGSTLVGMTSPNNNMRELFLQIVSPSMVDVFWVVSSTLQVGNYN